MYEVLLVTAHKMLDAGTGELCEWPGIYLLASFLEENGISARAFGGFVHEIEALLERELVANEVKLVGFSCDYENRTEIRQFCRMVYERWHLPVIVGGPQAIALGEAFLRDTGVAAIVYGEGELPILALAQFFIDGTGVFETIPGIGYLCNGKFQRNDPPLPIENLDALPFIDTSLVLDNNFRKRSISILTARGCPFRCSFCYEGSTSRKVRQRSVENVMQELRLAFENSPHVNYVLLTDDTFTLDCKRVLQFCEAFAEYRKERKFTWFAEAHPQTIVKHPEMLTVMVDSGLECLQISVESGSERVLRAYNKKTNLDMIRTAVRLCRKAGIPHIVANIIVGGACETEETLAESKQFALELLEIGVGMLEMRTVFYWPLPGTPITTQPEKYGMRILDYESLTSISDYPVVCCGDLTPELLSFFREDMTKAFQDKMRELAKDIPREDALRNLKYYFEDKTYNAWTHELLSINRIRRFCGLYLEKAISLSSEIPEEEIWHWHPQRQCFPIVRGDICYAEDLPISIDQFKVLKASAGRMNTQEAAAYCDMTMDDFLSFAKSLEDKMALAFARY